MYAPVRVYKEVMRRQSDQLKEVMVIIGKMGSCDFQYNPT